MYKIFSFLLKLLFRWLIPLVGLALLVGIPVVLLNLNQYIRAEALKTLRKQFPNADVILESAEFKPGEGLTVRGLRVRFTQRGLTHNKKVAIKAEQIILPANKSNEYDFLFIEEMSVVSSADWLTLIQKGIEVEQLRIRNADIILYPVTNQYWNFQLLEIAESKKKTSFREIVFEDVDCQVRDYRKNGGVSVYELRDINGKLVLQPDKTYAITGSMTGDYAKTMAFSGALNQEKKQLHLEGKIQECEISQRLLDALPEECLPRHYIYKRLAELKLETNVQGVLTMSCFVDWDGNKPQGAQAQYRAVGNVFNGRWDWDGLPSPITEIQTEFDVSNAQAHIKSFTGKMGEGSMIGSYRQWTYESNAKKELRVKLDNILLTPRMAALLPEKFSSAWKMFQPTGEINAEAVIRFDGNKWIPHIKVDGKRGGLLFNKFPYKLENLSGKIQWEKQVLSLALTDGKQVAFGANFTFPPQGLTGSFRLKGQGVSINDKLINACPEAARKIINEFDPKGTINVEFGMDFHGKGVFADRYLNISLLNCAARYEKFPYPLRNVNGRLEMKNNIWTFPNITCSTTPVNVIGSGSLNLQEGQAHDFLLSLKMSDLPIDKTLTCSMPTENAKLLEGLGISGSFNAQADISMRIGVDTKPNIKIHAVPIGNDVSLRAAILPYRLDRISGSVEFENQKFRVQNFTGYHDQTLICCQIDGEMIAGAGWRARLSETAIDRLQLDRELLEALPESTRKVLTGLNLSGPLHYSGMVDVLYNPSRASPLSAQWRGEIGVQEVSINKGITLRGICGGITTAGYLNDGAFYSEGALAIDSLLWENLQFSQIKGPYQINNDQLFFGTGAKNVLKSVYPKEKLSITKNIATDRPQSLSAKIFGGNFYADIVVLMKNNPQFALYVALHNARLEQCGELTQSERLQGKIYLGLNLWGTAGDTNSLTGRGDLRLSDADIYQLPAMVSMLKILSIREPNSNAFSNSEAFFRISGQHLFFDKINFRGDAISLYGTGEMDFNKRVNLSFYTLMGKGDYVIPVIHDLFQGVSKTAMMIRMEGPINDLDIRRESPLINDFRFIERELSTPFRQ